MAINPDNITTIRVDQLADAGLTLDSLFPHTVGTELTSSTIESLVTLVSTAIEGGIGVGYLPVSVTDGQTLPSIPDNPSFILVGAGTYINLNGFPDLICTEELNAIMSLSDHWEIAVQIPIDAPVGVQTVTGSAVDNTDPQNPVINSTGGGGGVSSVTGDLVDNTDPNNPIIETPTLQQVTEAGGITDQPIETGNIIATDVNGGEAPIQAKCVFSETSIISFSDLGGIFQFVINLAPLTSSLTYSIPHTINGDFCVTETKTTSFTAVNSAFYTANGTLTVTDPTPVTNKGFIVHVIGGTATIGGVGYTTGALVYRYYDGSVWISTNMNASGVAWGAITGTLSAQTDLQTALDAKVDENTPITGATKTKITYDAKGLVTAGADLSASDLPTGIDATKIADGSVTNTEFQYLDATSSIQTQLDGKQQKSSYMKLVSAYTLANTTALQKLFNVGSGSGGAYSAGANRTIYFKTSFVLSALSTSSGSVSFGILGTAGIASIAYTHYGRKNSTITGAGINNLSAISITASANALGSANTADNAYYEIEGIITTSTSGTIILAISTGVATASATVAINSNAEFIDIGADTFTATSDIT